MIYIMFCYNVTRRYPHAYISVCTFPCIYYIYTDTKTHIYRTATLTQSPINEKSFNSLIELTYHQEHQQINHHCSWKIQNWDSLPLSKTLIVHTANK